MSKGTEHFDIKCKKRIIYKLVNSEELIVKSLNKKDSNILYLNLFCLEALGG